MRSYNKEDKTMEKLRHLLDLKSLSHEIIQTIFEKASYFLNEVTEKNAVYDHLKGKVVANLFFESSTRTRNSFNIAAHRLGAIIVSPEMQSTALSKGESLMDTVHTFEAMGSAIFIIRHPENGTAEWIAQRLHSSATVINAGDGTNQHPTQGLIDLYTIHQYKKDWRSLTIAIVGDVLHSRVTHSLIDGLLLMGVPEIRLVAPPYLSPKELNNPNVKIVHFLTEGLQGADIIVSLRLQKERMNQEMMPEAKTFYQQFRLTAQKLRLAKSDAIVMHPGPMNRDIEIAPEVADGPQSVILKQVQNGIAIRMAIMDLFQGP